MAAFSIANVFKPKARLRFTAKAFHGRLYERAALAYCRQRGYRVCKTNFRFSGGEIDILAESRDGRQGILLEVRGRGRGYCPTQIFSPPKLARLRRFAILLSLQQKRTLRIELVRVTGKIPESRWKKWFWLWGAGWFPGALGLKLEVFTLEAQSARRF